MMDCVHRIRQTKQAYAFRFITENSMEECICSTDKNPSAHVWGCRTLIIPVMLDITSTVYRNLNHLHRGQHLCATCNAYYRGDPCVILPNGNFATPHHLISAITRASLVRSGCSDGDCTLRTVSPLPPRTPPRSLSKPTSCGT
jgi:hypothetical protein